MTFMRLTLFFLLLVATTPMAKAQMEQDQFKIGQVWQVKGLEDTVELTVGQIETLFEDTVISISIYNLPVPHEVQQSLNNRTNTSLLHLPISEEALRKSIGYLKRTNEKIDLNFYTGYDTWKAALEAEKAGYFTVSIPEAINVIFQTLDKGEITND